MDTWLIIGVIVFSTLVCGSFQTCRSRKREQAWRERSFSEAECSLIKECHRYDIILSDGRAFHQAEILGTAQGKEAEFLFGYGSMLVLRLSDGRTFRQAEILGTAQGKEADFLFGYGSMLVLRLSDDRKAYVRQACIRCMIESKILED